MRAPITVAVIPAMLAVLAAGPAPRPVAPPVADGPEPVTLALAAIPAREQLRRLVMPYATATGTALGDATWDGSADGLRKLSDAHQADLVLVDGPSLAAGCRAQALDHLDWSTLDRDRFLPAAATDCGAGAFLSATVLAWDRDKVAGTPGWGDFWDVAKHPGRRGLRRAARGNLEIALLADGVAAGDVYRTLRTPDGVDRAFRKLDQLKPYIEWWDQPQQPAQFLASARVLLISAPAAGLTRAGKAHVGVQWGGSLGEVASWVVPAGAQHKRGAGACIAVASDAARQAEFARGTGLGPATRPGFALLPVESRPQNPSLPANLQAGLMIDEGFWLDNGDKLEGRFAAWVGK